MFTQQTQSCEQIICYHFFCDARFHEIIRFRDCESRREERLVGTVDCGVIFRIFSPEWNPELLPFFSVRSLRRREKQAKGAQETRDRMARL